MKLFYSAETRGFYREDIHGNDIPVDAVEISKTDHESLIRGQSEGKRIVVGEDGNPRLADPSEDPLDKLASRKRREIDRARDSAFAEGMSYEISGDDDVVQTRPQDQINLLGLRAKAETKHEQGVTDAVMKFRGKSNQTRYLTPEEMIALTGDALAHIEDIYERSWDRKDAVDEALENEDREGIEAVEW